MASDNPNVIPRDKRGSIIVCGGSSRRMGYPKAELPLGDRALVEWVAVACLEHTAHCIIVGNLTEEMQNRLRVKFGERLTFTRDQNPNLGPLEGIRTGLAALPSPLEAAFVSSCDVPLLAPAIVPLLFEQLGDSRGVIPVSNHRIFGLTAVYRPEIIGEIELQMATGNRRVSQLPQFPQMFSIPVEKLRTVDPELDSIINLNTPEDYISLCQRANLTPPRDVIEGLNSR